MKDNIPYIKIKVRDFWLCFFLGLFALAYFYPNIVEFFASESSPYYNNSFQTIINNNLNYIYSHVDVLVLYIICILIPLICYLAYIIVNLSRWIWDQITNDIIKEYFYRFRVNFIIFTIALSIYSVATGELFFNIVGMIIGIILLIFFNLFTTRVKVQKEAVKSDTTLLVAIIITGTALVFGYQIDPIRQALNDTYTTIQSDIWFSIFLTLTLIFSIAWPILTRMSMVFVRSVIKYQEKIATFLKAIIFLVFIYFIAKVAIFNINQYAPEPYPTMLSAIISLVSSMITRFSAKITGWFRDVNGRLKGALN